MNRVKRLRRADDHRRFRAAVARIERVADRSAAAQVDCSCSLWESKGAVQWECPWHGVQTRSPAEPFRYPLRILSASELLALHASGRLFYRTPKRTVATYEFTARPMGNGCLGCLAINVRAVYCPIGAKHG